MQVRHIRTEPRNEQRRMEDSVAIAINYIVNIPITATDNDEQSTTRRSSSLHLQAPYLPTPESATLRAKRFQDHPMLSLLLLLLPERYFVTTPHHRKELF